MTEEPYRWVEAIQNRREYIEHQIAAGSPIVCVSCAEGVLLLTVSRDRQKIFEIYDRIAMGAIGHPGDIERLRMSAIEVTSSEGFTRAAQDVSLRRLVNYSLSPALKTAFEQVYGAPYLARLLLAELGRDGGADLFVRLDFDGGFQTNGGILSAGAEPFCVVAGRSRISCMMENFLRQSPKLKGESFRRAYEVALDAWMVGHMAISGALPEDSEALPSAEAIASHREAQLLTGAVEAAVLDRAARTPATYRPYSPEAPNPNGEPAKEALSV